LSHRIESAADVSGALEAAFADNELLLVESDLGPAFFDLRSGVAGELLQKFVNNRVPLAIVLPSPAAHGERFSELVREHRSHPVVRFFASGEEARHWLETQRA
jgi:hypothetical protein